jgi:hypothetical protein
MTRSRTVMVAVVCLGMALFATPAWGKPVFHPRVGGALGLVPPVNSQGKFSAQADVATGSPTPLTYHGGSVMPGGITMHLIFWTGGTNPFQGQPAGAPANYEGMIERLFTDVAHDSGGSANVFSVLPQFAQGTRPGAITPGNYSISYSTAAPNDTIIDSNPYPAVADQCASPQDTAICITDGQVQSEVDHIVSTHGGARGLHNMWFVFLPPGVDECIDPGVCGTNAFGAYHSVSDVGNGPTIYAVGIDPIIEAKISPGADPQGYPDAEAAMDAAAHETVEAMTDPEGIGWMDPNGFEVADKCEFGPQRGTPLGFAPDGSPFNQVINGHQYLIQQMWSNDDNACVDRTSQTSNPLPLPQVNLTQFSSTVSGNIESATPGVGVRVSLVRADAGGSPVTVAQAATTTAGDGTWSVSLAPHAVGDDRDEIDVDYSNNGAPSPSHQVILTGNGGNPFTESGWTGWTALDNGSSLTNDPSLGGPSLSMSPCFQTGVLSATLDGAPLVGPHGEIMTDFCNTQTGIATMPLTRNVSQADVMTDGSNDNRAFSPPEGPTPNPVGGLVGLTVPVGEPDAVSLFLSPMAFFTPSGFPTCGADLEGQSLTCAGLVPDGNYTATDGSAHSAGTADGRGILAVPLAAKGGNVVSLSNGARNVTTLHVASLHADINGSETVLSGGTCQPGQYFDPPLDTAPTNASAGFPTAFAGGAALTGQICPTSGNAAGLPSGSIVQTDELSGGQTQTEVPDLENTSPLNGEIVYGHFTAVGESGFPGPANSVTPDRSSRIAFTVAPAGGGGAVFTTPNVNTINGTPVPALSPGSYSATWLLTDVNGDTRTVSTRFVEVSPVGPRGPQGPPGPGLKGLKLVIKCKLQSHNTIKCTVTFKKASTVHGKLQLRIAHGSRVTALGHATVRAGKATLKMRELRRVVRGRYTLTVVMTQAGSRPKTMKQVMRLR